MTLTYRKLAENELESFIALRVAQLTEEGAKADFDLKPALRDYYKRHMADGTFVSFIALDGDRIVGTSALSVVERPPHFGCPSGRIGILSSMYTQPDCRRRGIARTLLSRIMEQARALGLSEVQITASDMGVLLYTAFGFEKSSNFMRYKL